MKKKIRQKTKQKKKKKIKSIKSTEKLWNAISYVANRNYYNSSSSFCSYFIQKKLKKK